MILRYPSLRGAAAVFFAGVTGIAASGAEPRLHVSSPDWRDQVIYFVLTDRFADGDASNNDQGAGEFAAGKPEAYNGGDLRGLEQHLDYIRGLGATAVWVTPPVANQWTRPHSQSAGYHGYWAEHFMKVDRHLGTLADYQRLSRSLHGRGMYLVQDIVVNHTGDFFHYSGGWDPADPTRFYTASTGSRPGDAPSQPPFHLNDPRRAADRKASIYHWTPDITDFREDDQVMRFQLQGLDDLDTENGLTRTALRRSYGYWIREAGVDAFRVDTAFYVPPEFFDDFLHGRDAKAPGIERVAQQTGRTRFLVFGEGFGIDAPGEEAQSRRIERYMTGSDGRALMPGMLNFPLYGALGDAFARGRPTSELADRIARMMRVHSRPHLMPTFLDNHDVDRFLAGGSEAGLRQGLLALMTLPGIPVIYYGTEQGFRESRAAMFAAGYGSGGRDHFDADAPLYRYVASVTALRRAHRVFSRGTPQVLKDNPVGPGVLAWRMTHEGEAAIVVFNTADAATLLDNLDTGLVAGTVLEGRFGIESEPANVVVGEGGRVTMRLAARSGFVWMTTARRESRARADARISTQALARDDFDGDFPIAGDAAGARNPVVVVDGDLAVARPVSPGPDGRWHALVETQALGEGPHTLVVWDEASGAASASQGFRVTRPWKLLAEHDDPAGDDRGPGGSYVYPTDSSWGTNHQMDLRRVRVFGSGGSLRIDLTTHRITRSWQPPNGFDHVAFTVFVQMPGREGGAEAMPLQFASLPGGMRWHYRLRVHGWSNALFSSEGASATQEGTAIAPSASVSVDADTQTVSLVLSAAALGRPASLSGARIYVNTWDYDAAYRPLAREPSAFAMGGGDHERGARVMDDTPVIVVP
jgi:glycosidase